MDQGALTDTIGVLVVDDSALMRNLISRIINDTPDLMVVGTAMNGRFALSKLERMSPDAIVLDIEMPEMNGIEFLRERAARGIEIPVIILSSIATKGAAVTMEALSLGAADFITKPSGSVSHDIHVVGEQLTALLRGFGGRYRRRHGRTVPEPPREFVDRMTGATAGAAEARLQSAGSPPPASPQTADRASSAPTLARPAAPKRTPRTRPGRIELVAIGISTGGPNALRTVVPLLDATIGVPIVVVQHMPAGFTTEFAASLDRITDLEVGEARDGEELRPNRILITPGDWHVEVHRSGAGGRVRLHQEAPRNGHRPSADVLFASVAAAYGNRALAVIMTGMGRDGALEIGAIYEAGGITAGQDKASSVVYGMPRVAFENGYLQRQLALDEIAPFINESVRGARAT